jgi:hypothetical protein
MYFVLRFASGMSLGYGAAFNGTLTSGTLQRGARLSTGLTAPLKIWGFSGPLNIAGTPTGNIYAGTDGPVTGSVATGSLGISGGLSTNRTGVMLTAPYTLAAATPYRLVLQGSTASTIFRSYKTGTVNAGSASDLMASFPGNGTQTITEEQSGTPNTWGLDDTNAYCPVTVHIYDQVAAGGGLLVPGGMRGGMHG